MNTVQEAIRLHKIVKSVEKDPLKTFVAGLDADRLEEVRILNLEKVFKEARKYGLRYIHIGDLEICGCEYKKCENNWPAVWQIAKEVGFPGSAGNGDQYQCHDASLVFPVDSYGGWDLQENRKLTDEEVKEKNFYFVVNKFRKSAK